MGVTPRVKAKNLTNSWRGLWREPGFGIATLIIILSLLLFILVPVFVVIIKSIGWGSGEITLSNYKVFFKTSYYFKALLNSLLAAVVTTIIVIPLSTIFSLYVTRSSSIVSKMYRSIVQLPLVAPPFIFSLALIILLGRRGIISSFISSIIGGHFSIYGFKGVVVAQILGSLPIAFMLIESSLRTISGSVENASRDLGSGQARTIMRVTLPLALNGIVKAALLVFVMAIADFGNPMIIGGGKPFLASSTYLLVIGQHNMEMAAVLGVFLIIPSLIVFLFQTYFLKGKDYSSIDGTSGGKNLPLTKLIKTFVFAISTAIVIAIASLFAIVFIAAFVKVIEVNNTVTLENFATHVGWGAVYTSVKVSFLAAVLSAILGILQGYLLERKGVPAKSLIEFTSLFGLAVPGTVMGIGYVLTFNGSPFFLTGTVLLLVLNMTYRKIGVGMQAAISKLQQIDRNMEDASSDLGSSPYRTFFKVTLPLLSPAVVVGFVYTFMTSMVSVSAIVFLMSPRTRLAAAYILNLAEAASIGRAAAMSVVIILIAVICQRVLNIIEEHTQVGI